MSTDNIIREILWRNSFERRRKLRRIYEALGLLLFVGLSAGALFGMWRMFR